MTLKKTSLFGKQELVNCVRDAVKRGITYVYGTNLYLHGTGVTRSFAAFGGSCTPDRTLNALPMQQTLLSIGGWNI